MSRLPFDAGKAGGAEPGAAADPDVLSVGRLSALISATLERGMPASIRVRGEVSNLSARNHWYFSLKDDEAVIGCVAWASTVRRFGFRPGDGDAVIATGHVGHYATQGRTQLYVTALEPAGEGLLERRFRALCDELRRLGYFDDDRKRPLPVFPRRIAVITSATGAALQDVVATAAARCRAVGLHVVDVRVQGEGAAEAVAEAVGRVDRDRDRLGVDAILVTRGGGSIEDLWAFNERVVADAVLRCHLPVVAAIGHESDTTVIELVADRRAATPTQAIMHLVPDGADLARQVEHLQHRLRSLVRRRLERERERLDAVVRHELFARPEVLVERGRRQLEHLELHFRRALRLRTADDRARLALLADRLLRAVRRRIDQRDRVRRLEHDVHRAAARAVERTRRDVDRLAARLDAVDPRLVLARGYSYTVTAAGTLVRRVGDVGEGDLLDTHVADGSIRSTVGGSRARRRHRAGGADGGQPNLFDGS
jgi:exodeoxyribonuclease VII large subunit